MENSLKRGSNDSAIKEVAVPIKNDDNDDVFDNSTPTPNSTTPVDESTTPGDDSTTLACTTQTEAAAPQPQPRKSVPRFRY